MSIVLFRVAIVAAICVSVAVAVNGDDFPPPVNTEKSTTTPMLPEEVLKTVKLPAGFQLSLVAAEPLVQNPIAMTMDERGRLWIAENYSWAGAGAGGFDRNQRDRIVILEDTDGDGTHDKRTVFWDDARMLTSIEVGNGGVWAICLPNMVFIPDANRDDVPDQAPVVVLDGFDAGMGNHTPANGLKWGPDGWLYGRSGILSPANIGKPGASESQRFQMNTGIWRYHPQRQIAEPVMHGMTNSWGFDFDRYGEMFVINTVIGHLWHVIPGAHTERMFGADNNPFVYKLLPQVADHVHWDTGENWADVRGGVTDKTDAAGGGHAHIGLMIYQGDNWPAEYRDRVYTLNLHGRRINSDLLKRTGAGYTATHSDDLCFIADPWFRGMELLTGPDGGVYICDWSDTGECHDHDGVHRTSGRVYKLTYGESKKIGSFDLGKATNRELVSYLGHSNTWWARQARRMLTERAVSEEASKAIHDELISAFRNVTETVHRIRLMEALATTGAATDGWLMQSIQSADEYVRLAALKILVDRETQVGQVLRAEFLKQLQELADSDPSGLVQLHVASAIQRLPVERRWEIVERLASRGEYAQDRMLPLMIWYGIEPGIVADSKRSLALVQTSHMPVLTELISRRLSVEIERSPVVFEQLLGLVEARDCPFPESVLSGIAQGLNGWKKVRTPEVWGKISRVYSQSASEQVRKDIQSLNVVFGDGRTMEELKASIVNKQLTLEVRQAALRSLLVDPPKDFVTTLFDLLNEREMAGEAIRGLALYDSVEVPQRILKQCGAFDKAQRVVMIETLSSRPAFAKELLNAIRTGKVSSPELSAYHARQIASFGNEELTNQLKELWGEIKASPAEKRKLIDDYKTRLTPEVTARGNRSAGRKLFQASCANCHVLFGEGRLVGPDLTGSNRKNLDYLLENVIDPSASVGASFRTVVIVLKDGRILNGVVSESNERTLTVQSVQGATTLDRGDIDEMQTTDVSVMPEGLFQNLTAEQIQDLVSYLMSSEQVPLPAE